MTKPIFHRSMMDTLQTTNLWLDSILILFSRYVNIGWIEHGNPDYTYLKDIETKIEKAIAKVAKIPTAAAQIAFIKEEKFIQCISNWFYGTKVKGDGIIIQTTKNYYKPALNLLRVTSSIVNVLA